MPSRFGHHGGNFPHHGGSGIRPVSTPNDLPPQPTLTDLYQVNQPSTQGALIEKVLILQGLCGAICGILSLVISVSIGASIQIACIIIAVPNFLLSCASSCCGRTNKLFVIKRAMYCTVTGLLLLIFGVITNQYFSVIDACVDNSIYYGNGAYFGNAAQCMSTAKWYDQDYCNCYVASEDMCVVSRDFTCQEVIDKVPTYAKWVEVLGILSFVFAVVVVGAAYIFMPNDLSTPTDSPFYYAQAPAYQFPAAAYAPTVTTDPSGAVFTNATPVATTAAEVPMIGTVQVVVDKPPVSMSQPIASAPPSMDMYYSGNIANHIPTTTTTITTSNDFNHNNTDVDVGTHNNYSFLNTFSSDTAVVKPAYVR